MQEELKKSLTDLIDETLMELEELKKSRFSAAEIELKGPGAEELAGKPTNGKLDAEKAEDKKEEDEEDEDKKDEAEKAQGKKSDADMGKAEDKKDEDKKDEDKKDDKKDEDKKDDSKDEDKKDDKKPDFFKKSEEEKADLRKSDTEMESLMKSYVDEKVATLETKLSSILDAVAKIAEQPVAAKGVSYKGVAPLMKSNEAYETLSKAEVASKLFDLKKSGVRVDSNDIARAEIGHDLEKIVTKYNIK